MDVLESLEVMELHTLDGLTVEKLKDKYKQKAKEYHPDKRGGDSRMFVKLSNAYTTLKDIVAVQEAMDRGAAEEKKRQKGEQNWQEKNSQNQIKNALVIHKKALKKNKDQIDFTKAEVIKITKEHLLKEQVLKEEFENVLKKIRSQYKENLSHKIKRFFKIQIGASLEERETALREKFEQIQKDLDNEYNQQLVLIYGQSLNRIQKELNELSL